MKVQASPKSKPGAVKELGGYPVYQVISHVRPQKADRLLLCIRSQIILAARTEKIT